MPNVHASGRRYGWPLITLHWLMFVFMAVAYLVMEWRGFVPRGAPLKTTLMHWHWAAGLALLAAWWLRVAARVIGAPPPPITPAPPAWEMLAARAMHLALYALMLLLPVTGYLMVNAKGRVVELAGFALPAVIAASEGLAETLEEIHEILGTAGYVLIGLHVLASVWHHWVQKDDTLRRMLPAR